MKWGVFCKKWKMGVFFCKKVENGGVVKSGPFLNAGCIMYSRLSVFLFYILLIWGDAYAPNAPHAYGPGNGIPA